MLKRYGLGLLLITFLLVGLGSTHTATAVAQGNPNADILRLVNELRANYGLPPFTYNAALAAAAQNQANFMATNNVYTHTGAGGSTPQTRALAAGYVGRATENIVGGTSLTPSQGVVWWRNSPIHFATMISDQYIEAGVGFAQGFDQNFYALVVGTPSDRPPIISAAEERRNNEVYAPVAPIVLAAPREDGSIVHVVGPGQSLWVIAARYEISLSQLLLYNNLQEDSLITAGDELLIQLAEGQEPPPTPTPRPFHVVREGETPWTIAAIYGLTLEEFYWLNQMTEFDVIHAGNEVRVALMPGEAPPPTPTPQLAHVVRSGDTLWGIANRYGLPLENLLAYNNLAQNAVLSIGQALLIVAPTPPPTATPEVTATLPPTAVPTSTATPTPTVDAASVAMVAPTATAVSTPAPGADLREALNMGALAVGVGLLLLAGVAIVMIRRQ